MTIAILSQEHGQKIARPFNRTNDVDEMLWLLTYHAAYQANKHLGPSSAMRLAKVAAGAVSLTQPGKIVWGNVDTEEPVLVLGPTKFYAFTEV